LGGSFEQGWATNSLSFASDGVDEGEDATDVPRG
jgi:hypothetical protein